MKLVGFLELLVRWSALEERHLQHSLDKLRRLFLESKDECSYVILKGKEMAYFGIQIHYLHYHFSSFFIFTL
ncbi:hypothetical protein M5K25_023969 [Dendrobium thyrsiflorum]|uniref:Uncharacterized protein n=1 Tax=Dendrobium thyrsiflorum TaxID=117978 RepID=A0ABD0U0K5_DENTH